MVVIAIVVIIITTTIIITMTMTMTIIITSFSSSWHPFLEKFFIAKVMALHHFDAVPGTYFQVKSSSIKTEAARSFHDLLLRPVVAVNI